MCTTTDQWSTFTDFPVLKEICGIDSFILFDQVFDISDIDVGTDTDKAHQLIVLHIVLIDSSCFLRYYQNLFIRLFGQEAWRFDIDQSKITNLQHTNSHFRLKDFFLSIQDICNRNICFKCTLLDMTCHKS
ncbi:hypothetical protein D3C81_1966330 [compost metagenome]